ncbi:3-hydroxyacyl-CoA dehydrogenase family protein [Thermodesulfobacteriota bacterium]
MAVTLLDREVIVSMISDIAVIGAGLMGHGIAQIFAVKGYNVTIMDLTDEIVFRAIDRIRSNLSLMAQYGIGSPDDIEQYIKKINTTVNLKEAVSEAQLIIEAIPENLEMKQRLFQDLDSLCSEKSILASNTSVISITMIAEKARSRERIIGTHFWNPPYLIPLVEIVKGEETSNQTVVTIFDLLKQIEKRPVRVEKDVPGFVGNRLQHALWREAISIVEHGIADAATVDECIKYGFGLRLPILGPLENADMVGLDLTLSIHDYILKHLESSPNASSLLEQKVKNGELGFKSGSGFYQWSPRQAEESQKNLINYLLEMIQREMKVGA